MAKITEESTNVLNLNESDDVLDDIHPGDYVFVVSSEGMLRGISLPEDDEQEVSEQLEKIVNYIVEVSKEVAPRVLH
jgi:hypothetical protein